MATVLVIDDEPSIRRIVAHVLRTDGHDVLEAENGKEGVRIFQAHAIDLVVTDLVMPEQEGIETTERLLALDPSVPVVAMSGGGRGSAVSYLKIAQLVGARATLEKPFTLDQLRTVVAEVLTPRGTGTLGPSDPTPARPTGERRPPPA